jgi:hypothetical protein
MDEEYTLELTTLEDIKDVIELELYRQYEQEQKETYFSDNWD